MFALKMVVGRIWNFNLFKAANLLYLVLPSKSSISGGIPAVFLSLSNLYVHLTAYLTFFIHDDILTTGGLDKTE